MPRSAKVTSDIAIVATTIPLSLERFQRPLIQELKIQGYEVLAVSSPGPELASVSREETIPTRAIPMPRAINPLQDLISLTLWLRLLRETRPKVVIAMTPKASLVSMITASLTRTPIRIYQCVGLRAEGKRGVGYAVLWLAEWLTNRLATTTVANSPSLAQRLVELKLTSQTKLRYTTSDHGVDTRYFRPAPPKHQVAQDLGIDLDRPVIGFVGRLTEDKGIRTLHAALTEAHTWNTVPQLLIVGPQNEADSQHWVDTLMSLKIPVVLTGMADDVRPYFSLMTVHVLPSLREGYPNVILEASAMRIPTITTTATGCIDSLRPPEEGWIVPKGDSIALASAISDAISDSSARDKRAGNAQARAIKDFRPDDVARRTVKMMGLARD